MTFNLRQLVREVCGTSNTASPNQLADEIYGLIEESDRDSALRQALPEFVRHFVSLDRCALSSSPGGQGLNGSQAHFAAGGYPSRKVRAIGEAWRLRLRERVSVIGPGKYKFLAYCTIEDHRYAASVRRGNAQRNVAKAEEHDFFAALLEKHGVAFLAELPEDIQAQALSGGKSVMAV